MRVVMVSDAHATGLDDPSQQSLVQWLDGVRADRLVLLGDLFHHWWGFPDVVWGPYVPLCAALLGVRARGVPITFVPGNHDFAVGSFLRERVGVEVRGPHLRELDGVRFLLAHGDEADRRWQYRLTRALLRGRGMAATMRLLGPRRGHRLLQSLAGASRRHGGDPTPLVQAQRRWAEQRLGGEADVVVMGHLHTPMVVHGPRGTFVNMGDWLEHQTWLEVVDGRPRLLQGLEGRLFAE